MPDRATMKSKTLARTPGAGLALCTAAGLALLLPACAQNEKPAPANAGAVRATPTGGANPAVQAPATPLQASLLRERAIEALEAGVKSDQPTVRANAIEAASTGPARVRTLVAKGLSDPTPGVRAVAALAIGRNRLGPIAEEARGLLNDESAIVRSAAIFALAANGRAVDRTPLASLLLSDPNPRVRANVAYILGELRDTSAAPLLRTAVRRGSASVAPEQRRLFELQVAEALIKLGDEDQRQVVRAALYPSRPEELEATALAAQILGEVGDQQSRGPLSGLVSFRDAAKTPYPPEIRLAAAASLARLGTPDAARLADEYAANPQAALRTQAATVYGLTGASAHIAKLAAMLDDADPTVRVAAAGAILRANPARSN